jgi:hypothetical protein
MVAVFLINWGWIGSVSPINCSINSKHFAGVVSSLIISEPSSGGCLRTSVVIGVIMMIFDIYALIGVLSVHGLLEG